MPRFNPDIDTTAFDRIGRARETGLIYENQYAHSIEAGIVTAPNHFVLHQLGLAIGDPGIRRLRVVNDSAADQPVSASISWFRGELAQHCPKLTQTEPIIEGTIAHIEASTALRVAYGTDHVSAGRANQTESRLLDIEPGDPIRRVETVLCDIHGGVIEYTESISLEDRWSTYRYEFDLA